MDTLFYLENNLSIPKENLEKRSVHEIISLIKRLNEHLKKKEEQENAKTMAMINAMSRKR